QVARLRLPRDAARSARVAVLEPRPAPELARAVPVRLRAFLVEQLLLSELASAQSAPARAAYVQAFVAEAGIPAEQVAALQADAADLYAGQQRWLAPGEAAAWGGGSEAWNGGVADEVMEKVAAAVTENLEAIVTEVKQTGELGALLAKAAAGTRLSAEEKRKVKEQLVDLAKAVPALALFAAPGGMLLLPVLAKLLPFSVLPSAWEKDRTKQGGKKP
ncbi:MAG TPA: LETM1 domain-containing protein, partial [Anaeromyxobacteraceae bacterium]|nr:LETM1 domain-containing protein [Anaeromyxobacteraceae bacterium]